jgi:hypothetical protein
VSRMPAVSGGRLHGVRRASQQRPRAAAGCRSNGDANDQRQESRAAGRRSGNSIPASLTASATRQSYVALVHPRIKVSGLAETAAT